jgi:hypothetical protein
MRVEYGYDGKASLFSVAGDGVAGDRMVGTIDKLDKLDIRVS